MYYNLFSLLLFASFSSESQKKEESMNNFCVEEFLSLSTFSAHKNKLNNRESRTRVLCNEEHIKFLASSIAFVSMLSHSLVSLLLSHSILYYNKISHSYINPQQGKGFALFFFEPFFLLALR